MGGSSVCMRVCAGVCVCVCVCVCMCCVVCVSTVHLHTGWLWDV